METTGSIEKCYIFAFLGPRHPLTYTRFKEGVAADRHIGRLIGGKKVLLGKDIDMPGLPNVLCVIIV